MNTISKLLFTLIAMVGSFQVFAADIKVNVSYASSDTINSYYSLVESVDFKIQDNEYSLKVNGDSYISYTIAVNGKEKGTLDLIAGENDYQWVFNWSREHITISFGDYNDPRELLIAYNGKEWWMENMEPDCNSVFTLHKEKATAENREGKPLATAIAKQACGQTKWKIETNDDAAIDQPVLVAYILSSSLAISVRAIYRD